MAQPRIFSFRSAAHVPPLSQGSRRKRLESDWRLPIGELGAFIFVRKESGGGTAARTWEPLIDLACCCCTQLPRISIRDPPSRSRLNSWLPHRPEPAAAFGEPISDADSRLCWWQRKSHFRLIDVRYRHDNAPKPTERKVAEPVLRTGNPSSQERQVLGKAWSHRKDWDGAHRRRDAAGSVTFRQARVTVSMTNVEA